MKILSHFALAAALAGGVAAGPALAKDKEAAKPAGLKLTPAFIKAAKPAQDAVNGGDTATAEPLAAAAEAAANTDDEKFVAAQIRLVLEQKKVNARTAANPNAPADRSGMIKPLDTLIANPATPAADRGRYYFQRGLFAYEGRQFPIAADYFTKARDLGYTNDDAGLLLVKAKIEGGDVAGGTDELDKEIGKRTAAGQKAPLEWYRYAVAQSNKRHAKAQTMNWLVKYASAYPSPKTWYEVLVFYGIQQDSVAKLDRQQTIDLFRLMRAAGAMQDQYSYIEYVQKAEDAGLPVEGLAVLKEGLANGKVPAANPEAKALQLELTNKSKLEGPLGGLETRARAGATGALALQTGDAYLSNGNYAKAGDLYRVALAKGGVDADTANTRLGIALTRSGDKAGAQAAFGNVKAAPRADIAQLWTTFLTLAPAA